MKLDIEVKLNEGMKKYIYKIWEKLENEDRTEYDVALENYRKYLLKETVKNPEDVSVVCQLAGVCYLSRKCDGIEILETFLKRNFDILTEDEKFRMYADLAYLCEDRGCMEEKAIDYLEKAIKINSNNADIYYRLAGICFHVKMYQKSLENIDYRVLCKIYLGNKDTENIEKLLEKIKEFEMLEKTDYEKYLNWLTYEGFHTFDEDVIKDLFYLCDNYEKYCKYADKSNFYLEANSIAPYLYSLKQLRKFEKINKIVKKAEKEILQNIEDIKNDEECQKNMTEEEILEIIKSEKKRLANINLVSEKILNTDFKPKMKITMFFKYECWMADCPQHLIIDED